MGDIAKNLSAGAQVAGAVSGVVGGLMANTRRQQQYGDQVKLMGIQQGNQMALNRQMQEIQMENWEKTNYDAQRKQMEKAGLNTALMYGGSGGGGMIAQSGSGGSAASGNAPIPENGLGIMGIGLQQNAMAMQQMDNMKADAELKRAQANEINTKLPGGLESQGLQNKGLGLSNESKELENQIKSRTLEDVIATVGANRNEAIGKAQSSMTQGNIDEATYKSQINEINSKAINEAFKLTLMKSDANLNNEKARAVSEELAQEWERLSIELDKVGVSKMQNAINEFTAKVNARLGQGNLNMRGIEAGLNATSGLLKKGVNASGTRNTTINNY
jgi:hypothetical protein